MSGKGKFKAEEASGPPGWIVSFSDMVTLLLAFFVLLQTFAHTRDPELFFAGQGSFRRAMAGFGLFQLMGGNPEQALDEHRSLKYPAKRKPGPDRRSRVIDQEDEDIRNLFKAVKESFSSVQAANLDRRSLGVFPTPIEFAPSSAWLNDAARTYLSSMAGNIRLTARAGKTEVYVIALAADEKNKKLQWVLSAQRADAVGQFLGQALAAKGGQAWKVQSWGAGPGGNWSESFGMIPDGTHVILAIMGVGGSVGR